MSEFIKFSEATKKVLTLAQNETLKLDNPSVDSEHLLLPIHVKLKLP